MEIRNRPKSREPVSEERELCRHTSCLRRVSAVVSLLCYSLCVITVLTAVAGAMVGLFVSTSERMGHTPHQRATIERDDRELRLFMIVPKRKYGSPARNIEANSAVVPTEKADSKKSKSHKRKVLAPRYAYGNTRLHAEESPNQPSSLFSTGDPDWGR
jgi:hypothetical protein